jgi:anthranilate 1,2-dioxygenase small subunit
VSSYVMIPFLRAEIIENMTKTNKSPDQAGHYVHRVVRTAQGWCYQSKRAIYDTSRVQILLVTKV